MSTSGDDSGDTTSSAPSPRRHTTEHYSDSSGEDDSSHVSGRVSSRAGGNAPKSDGDLMDLENIAEATLLQLQRQRFYGGNQKGGDKKQSGEENGEGGESASEGPEVENKEDGRGTLYGISPRYRNNRRARVSSSAYEHMRKFYCIAPGCPKKYTTDTALFHHMKINHHIEHARSVYRDYLRSKVQVLDNNNKDKDPENKEGKKEKKKGHVKKKHKKVKVPSTTDQPKNPLPVPSTPAPAPVIPMPNPPEPEPKPPTPPPPHYPLPVPVGIAAVVPPVPLHHPPPPPLPPPPAPAPLPPPPPPPPQLQHPPIHAHGLELLSHISSQAVPDPIYYHPPPDVLSTPVGVGPPYMPPAAYPPLPPGYPPIRTGLSRYRNGRKIRLRAHNYDTVRHYICIFEGCDKRYTTDTALFHHMQANHGINSARSYYREHMKLASQDEGDSDDDGDGEEASGSHTD